MAKDQEGPETERRFSQEQYDRLKQCSEKGEEGIEEWNQWREQNPAEDICLDGQDFTGSYLCGVNLMKGSVGDRLFTLPQNNIVAYSGEVFLRGADFRDAHVEGGYFSGAYLDGSHWESAKAQGADFSHARLQDAELNMSVLDECNFDEAILSRAQLTCASIRGADFSNTDLRGCTVHTAIVDGESQIWKCKVDLTTDFTGVGLDGAIVDPATKQLLEYNIRRMNWEQWYEGHRILKWLVKPFWWFSDYGSSTVRIVGTFVLFSLLFAALYYATAIVCPPGIVSSLLEGKEGAVPGWLVPVRAVYFSVVTMTTLGFGDMHANCQSLWGHLLLTIQVLLGYGLLGALVTRFAVLFTAGGPAGRFSESGRDEPN